MGDTRIHVPEMYTEPSRFATVVAVGPMRWVPGTWWNVPMPGRLKHPGIHVPVREALNQPWEREWRWIEGYYKPFEVNVGETVVSSRYPKSANPIIWHGQEFVIVDENEILARVDGKL